MKIAITSYVENGDKFVDEANLMTYSGRSLDDRFTFVIFAHPKIYNKIKKRKNVAVYPFTAANDKYYNQYKYAKSLQFVKPNEKILKSYDYIIKTDTDVFFTTEINKRNFDNNLYIGVGEYTFNQQSVDQIGPLAKKFGYDYTRISDMCSTVIGRSNDVVSLMHLSDILCKQIFYELCPDGNYLKQIDSHWTHGLYSGTSSMIATEIVASSLFKDRIVMDARIDASSFDIENSYFSVDHIHQMQGDGVFSKIDARAGVYDDLNTPRGNTIAEYCLATYLKFKEQERAAASGFGSIAFGLISRDN